MKQILPCKPVEEAVCEHGAGKLRKSLCRREVNGRLTTFDSMPVSAGQGAESTVTDVVSQEDEAGRRKAVAGDREKWQVDLLYESRSLQDPIL